MNSRKTLEERLTELKPVVEPRLKEYFSLENLLYPPEALVFTAFKEEKVLEVYVKHKQTGKFALLKTYPLLAASGHPGPKLREGDRQVPEGVYLVDFLNPNSLYHLALKLNYPNEFDHRKAQSDGRFSPGSNIMIHGNQVSNGCLAIGDGPIEDLFMLSAKTGIDKVGQRLGFKPEAFLNSHDSYNYFKQTDCLIKTGY
ncbi:MAG: L,D-transpeptidase family protein, partial [Candidatus Rifleibacteriota bacterium]